MGILPSIITHLRNVLSLLKKNSDSKSRGVNFFRVAQCCIH